jgi:hypothetical protein
MGRGRAKAKQTKVARDLKYNSPNTDLSALQAELGGSSYLPIASDFESADTENDPYAKYYEDDEDSDDKSQA